MAAWLSQSGRLLELTTPLGPEELCPIDFSGVEYISSLFQFSLSMISSNTSIDAQQLLGKAISLKLNASGVTRYFNGLITRFNAGAIKNGMRYYNAMIQPWLSLLNYTSDSRIFHNKDVIEIAQNIFQEFKFNNYNIQNITKHYKKRDYCVQYGETTLNFLHRLFQEEGVFYYFQHEETKHTLVLADSNNACKKCTESVVFESGSQKSSGLTRWQRQQAFYSGRFECKDYNYETPDQALTTQQTSSAKLPMAQLFGQYHYPGLYSEIDTGKNISQHRFEAHELNHDLASGAGNYDSFTAGGKFMLENLPVETDEGNYILLEVAHHASDNTYLHGAQGGQSYFNEFVCSPSKINIRPMVNAVKPVIYGTQTAIVTGPSGEEIYTDDYGRVKVQFHWDRKGKKDDYSSCWVRVAQNWAGKNWGTLFIPRIGQEVVVQFLEGNPDKPIIIGSVYNAEHLPPYHLPFEQTQSGIKTRSSKDGSINDANELRFEDKKGDEEIFIQAQKDFNRLIKNSENVTIVQGDQITQIQAGSSTLQAAKAIELKVGSNSLIINTQGVYINGQEVKVNN
jgi:type VI secretion system secreted protein VgrG